MNFTNINSQNLMLMKHKALCLALLEETSTTNK